MRLWVWSLALLSGLRIQQCLELWCRSQMWFGSHVAVALVLAGGYSSHWTPSLGNSVCHESSPRNGKTTRKKKRQKIMHIGVGTGQPVGLVWPTICFGTYSFTVTWSHLFGCCLGLLSCCNSRVDYLRQVRYRLWSLKYFTEHFCWPLIFVGKNRSKMIAWQLHIFVY